MIDVETKLKDVPPEVRRLILKAIADMVSEGLIEYITIDGLPGVRLVEKKHDPV